METHEKQVTSPSERRAVVLRGGAAFFERRNIGTVKRNVFSDESRGENERFEYEVGM